MANRRLGMRSGNALQQAPMSYAGGVGTLPQAQQSVLAPPGTFPRFGLDFSKAHTWSWIWFSVAVFYVFFIYAAHGGRRGGVV
jgi:hypothetical protein